MYILIVFMAIGALNIAIKTDMINHKNQTLKKELKRLQERNQTLQLYILDRTRHHIVEAKAKDEFKMIPPSEIIYIKKRQQNDITPDSL